MLLCVNLGYPKVAIYIMQKLYTIAVMKSLCHNENVIQYNEKCYIAIAFLIEKFYTLMEKCNRKSLYPNRKSLYPNGKSLYPNGKVYSLMESICTQIWKF